MRIVRYLIILLTLSLSGCHAIHHAEQFRQGKEYFLRGDFKKSFHCLLPVAYYGKPAAQYAVGYMYFYGYGIYSDEESGMFWMNLAASRCYLPAMEALSLLQRRDLTCKGFFHSQKVTFKGEYLSPAFK